MEKHLELRMYFFVPYNISPIQQGIQSGHALGEYCLKYGRYNPNHIVWNFLEKYKTWIILNGGTTNDERDFEMVPAGSLNLIVDQLGENGIEFSVFIEPDLNNALTAICFICDERVWNYKDYPDLTDYIINSFYLSDPKKNIEIRTMSNDELIYEYGDLYMKWVDLMGGEKNIFLRTLIKGKKLA